MLRLIKKEKKIIINRPLSLLNKKFYSTIKNNESKSFNSSQIACKNTMQRQLHLIVTIIKYKYYYFKKIKFIKNWKI